MAKVKKETKATKKNPVTKPVEPKFTVKEVEEVDLHITTKPTLLNRLLGRLLGFTWVKVTRKRVFDEDGKMVK